MVTAAGEVCVVQFPHPGGEHVPRGDRMPWNTGPHRRKFLRAEATIVDAFGAPLAQGPIAFWGEWEPPSRVAHRWPRRGDLPTVAHLPEWHDPGRGRWRQNTDPWVFGPAFLYSNCKQPNPGGTPSALQRLPVGSTILFGSSRAGAFVLDTVFVVGDIVTRYRPVDGIADASDAFRICTIESLAADPSDYSRTTFTLFRGATPDAPVNGTFSFVPCRRWSEPDDSRFARPAITVPTVTNPASRQSPSGATRHRSAEEVAAAWRAVVDQVTDAGLLLGIGLSEPPITSTTPRSTGSTPKAQRAPALEGALTPRRASCGGRR
jgi:hypothetical protein